MNTIYNIAMYCLEYALRAIAVLGKDKIKKGVEGRRNTVEIIKQKRDYSRKLVWFHAASLGEFEQGRPLIEKIKAHQPEYQILLTFFSPSGYEIRKNYPHADIISYLPIDTHRNAEDFLNISKPDLIFFIKYEFWFNYLNLATEQNIPTYYIAALFRPEQYFFKWYGSFMQPVLKKITHYFVQNQSSENQLTSKGIQQVSVVGDPRIDRVVDLAAEAKYFPLIEKFCNGKNIIVIGSSWQQDELILMPFINENRKYKYIIAPHEIDENHLQSIENQCKVNIVRYSKYQEDTEAEVLLIDNIGMLSSLYRYAKIAYIGGGFGSGIHNTLEPMAYHLPIIFGPKYQKFEEANAMTSSKPQGAFCIHNTIELKEIILYLEESTNFAKASAQTANYIQTNKGATNKIYEAVFSNM